MKILFIGEIVGKAGVYCVKTLLPALREEFSPEFVIANGDGATGGFGLGKNHSVYLRKLGLNVITGGDQIYFKRDMVTHIDSAHYLLRPANHPPGNPGRGWRTFPVGERRVAVINLLGQSGYDRIHLSNPFTYLPELAARALKETPFVVLDYHAVTTAEKYSMFHHADGQLSAVIGTGTRVQTADAHVMPNGTAVITDCGRTGSRDSVAGLDPDIEIKQFLTQIPERSAEAWDGLGVEGVLIELGDDGRAVSIQSFRRECQRVGDEREGDDNGD